MNKSMRVVLYVILPISLSCTTNIGGMAIEI